MNEKANNVCPICHNKCDIDIEDTARFQDALKKYNCNQCGDFILPIHIACLVSDVDTYEKYKASTVYDDTYDRDKMMEALREGISNYGEIAKSLHRAIRFCCKENDREKDTRSDERIYLTWDEQYHILEIK